ncbi:MAG: Ger(x)C family spore germination C-terminal domain-containing protein [Hominenteromicrobium sp.]
MKKKLCLCFAVLFAVLTVSGCAPELYERILISAIGVDRTDTGYRVTVRAAEADENGAETCLTGEGRTVPEALNQLAFFTGQKPLYSHNTVVIFGMECAQEGLNGCVDFFVRHYDSRPTVKIFLAETTAEEILSQENGAGMTTAQIADLSKSMAYSGLSVDANLIDLINGLYRAGISASLPVLSGGAEPKPEGTAILDGFKLRCTLTSQETRGLLALRGALQAGEAVISDPEGGEVSVSVRDSDCTVRFTGTAENPRFDIVLQIEGEISSVSAGDRRLKNEAFPRLERALAACVLEDAAAYLAAAVFEGGCDAVGFGEAVQRDTPEIWREIEESWSERLPEAVFDLHVTAAVSRIEEEDTPYL